VVEPSKDRFGTELSVADHRLTQKVKPGATRKIMNTAALPAPRIFDYPWTREQLMTVAESHRQAQEHSEYRSAARVMARRAGAVDLPRIRAMVCTVMGGARGTHYICGSLQCAHLAISFPDLFTARQRELLLAPLAAAETPGETRQRQAGAA
jgi:hypothetical protein